MRESAGAGHVREIVTKNFLKKYKQNSTHYADEWSEDRGLMTWFGNMRLREVKAKNVAEFRDWALTEARNRRTGKKGLGPGTVKKNINALGRLYTWAIETGRAEYNPVRDIEKPRDRKSTHHVLEPDEWTTVRTEAEDGDYEPWVLPYMTTILVIGADIADVGGLEWDRIKDRKRVELRRKKSGEAYTIEIDKAFRDMLAESMPRRLDSPFIFHDEDGQPFNNRRQHNRVSQTMARVFDRAGVRGSAKDLRRTFATWLSAVDGISPFEVAAKMGHTDLKTTSRYIDMAKRAGLSFPDLVTVTSLALTGRMDVDHSETVNG